MTKPVLILASILYVSVAFSQSSGISLSAGVTRQGNFAASASYLQSISSGLNYYITGGASRYSLEILASPFDSLSRPSSERIVQFNIGVRYGRYWFIWPKVCYDIGNSTSFFGVTGGFAFPLLPHVRTGLSANIDIFKFTLATEQLRPNDMVTISLGVEVDLE